MSHRSRRAFIRDVGLLGAMAALPRGLWAGASGGGKRRRPNIVLVMTDDEGWEQIGYNSGGRMKTPELDTMAEAGLVFDRFYSAAPVCSPTRASVMTGRHPYRACVWKAGVSMREEELTLAEVMGRAGYRCGHYGKWHLGATAPSRGKPPRRSPTVQGFHEWVSSPNWFDLDPELWRHTGEKVQGTGDGSEVIMEHALDFIRRCAAEDQPFLAVVWYGSPHNPYHPLPEDRAVNGGGGAGEMLGVDRSIGALRAELRKLGIAEDTLIWFTSDNGQGGKALPKLTQISGRKHDLLEGGIRVPAIVEWPGHIRPGRTDVPAWTCDIYPTVLARTGIPLLAKQPQPLDGIDLSTLFDGTMKRREQPMHFWVAHAKGPQLDWLVTIDNDAKLHLNWLTRGQYPGMKRCGHASPPAGHVVPIAEDWDAPCALFNLRKDAREERNLADARPEVVARMRRELIAWQHGVVASSQGKDFR